VRPAGRALPAHQEYPDPLKRAAAETWEKEPDSGAETWALRRGEPAAETWALRRGEPAAETWEKEPDSGAETWAGRGRS
jgi:hypothetical protein